MKLSLITLCLAAGAWAAPSPQTAGHSHGSDAEPAQEVAPAKGSKPAKGLKPAKGTKPAKAMGSIYGWKPVKGSKPPKSSKSPKSTAPTKGAEPANGVEDAEDPGKSLLDGILGPVKQMGGNLLAGMATSAIKKLMTPLPQYKKTTSEPVSKVPGVIREQLYYGPLVLKTVAEKMKEKPNPMQMDPQGNLFVHALANFPRDVSLLSSYTTVRDADGNALGISQGVYNHHVSIPDLDVKGRSVLSCANKSAVADFPVASIGGVGEDGGGKVFSADETPGLSAFYVSQKDNIMFTAEMINNSNATQSVYVVLDVEYVKRKPALTTSWHVLAVGMCDGKGIAILPEGTKTKFGMKSQPMTVQRDGFIFGVRGHLHDGGISVVMKNNNKVVCESKAIYGGENKKAGDWETISSMGSCADRIPIPVKKGDIVTLETSYDFDLHHARQHGDGMMAEAMGLALFSFAGNPPK